MPSPSANCSSCPVNMPRLSRSAMASWVASRLASIALAGAAPVTIRINPAAWASARALPSASAVTATRAPRSNNSRSRSRTTSETHSALGGSHLTAGFFLALDVDDHAGPESLVRQRVDQDERAGSAVHLVRIEEQGAVRLDRNLADFVQFQLAGFDV